MSKGTRAGTTRGRTTEEHPLETLGALQRVRVAKFVVLVHLLGEVEQDGGRLEHVEGLGRVRGVRVGGLVVQQDGDPAVGVVLEEPVLLLAVGIDVDELVAEVDAVRVLEL